MFKINKLIISIFLASFLLMSNLVSGMVVVDADSLGLECDAYNPILGYYDSDGIHLMKYNKIREICDVKDFRYGLYQRMNNKLIELSGFEGNTIHIGGPEDECIYYGEWIGSTCVLNQSLNENVEISASNIGLDCNGYSIIGSHIVSPGISISNKNNIIVKNCFVKEFEHGFYIVSSFNIDIINNTAIDNTGPTGKGFGFYLDKIHDVTLSDNKAYPQSSGNPNGFGAYGHGLEPDYDSYNIVLSNNEANNTANYAFYLYRTHNNTISNNRVKFAHYAFQSRWSFYNTYSDNEVLTGEQERVFNIDAPFVDPGYNIVTRNIIRHPSERYGIHIDNSSNNLIYDNHFIGDGINAFANTNNYWNITKTKGTNIIGGPYIGGNYWGDYAGTDMDGDSIGDTEIPYNSSGNINQGDYLPLVPDIVPPIITIFSPLNQTYENPIDIIFTTDEETSWIGYSLDGDINKTIIGNITITDLSVGPHNIIVYTNDTSGNIGYSDKIYFTVIDITPPLVTIIYPENVTYEDVLVDLDVSADEDIDTWWYSINSKPNITFNPPTTILTSYCSNELIVYANDTYSNVGFSVVYFMDLGADVINDGKVDIFDLSKVAMFYGCFESEDCYDPNADLNKDGVVDMRDMTVIALNWGKTC